MRFYSIQISTTGDKETTKVQGFDSHNEALAEHYGALGNKVNAKGVGNVVALIVDENGCVDRVDNWKTE